MHFDLDELKNNLNKFKFHTVGKVQFHEVDSFKVVHNLSYLYWTEISRVEYCNNLNIGVVPVASAAPDFSVFLVHSEVNYFNPARFLDNYLVYTRVKSLGFSSLEFEHFITSETGDLLVTNNAIEVYVNKDRVPIEIPKPIKEKIINFEGGNLIIKEKK